ncbi:TPA: phage tail protein [Vibrio parahaemolyticus]
MADKQYYLVVTDLGKTLIDEAYNNSTKVNIIEMALGDSGGSYVKPDSSFTQLVSEFGREDIHDDLGGNDGLIHVISKVTAKNAGQTVREFGLYDDLGNMIVYGAYPESLVPEVDSAEFIQLEIEAMVYLDNASAVTISVNPIYQYASEDEAGIIKLIDELEVAEKDESNADDSKALTLFKLLKRKATETLIGLSRFSTKDEAVAGTSTSTMLNPKTGLDLIKSTISSALDSTSTDYSLSLLGGKTLKDLIDSVQQVANNAVKKSGDRMTGGLEITTTGNSSSVYSVDMIHLSDYEPMIRFTDMSGTHKSGVLGFYEGGGLYFSTTPTDGETPIGRYRIYHQGYKPTAAEVGARPDDWMPTAKEVGAQPQLSTPFSTRDYVVSQSNNPELLNAEGGSIASGNSWFVRMYTKSTGTKTGAVYVIENDSGTIRLYPIALSGTSSNHPQLKIVDGKLVIYINHPDEYAIRVFMQEFSGAYASQPLIDIKHFYSPLNPPSMSDVVGIEHIGKAAVGTSVSGNAVSESFMEFYDYGEDYFDMVSFDPSRYETHIYYDGYYLVDVEVVRDDTKPSGANGINTFVMRNNIQIMNGFVDIANTDKRNPVRMRCVIKLYGGDKIKVYSDKDGEWIEGGSILFQYLRPIATSKSNKAEDMPLVTPQTTGYYQAVIAPKLSR